MRKYKCNQSCGKKYKKNGCGSCGNNFDCNCNNVRPLEENCNNIRPLNSYEKCEQLAKRSRELYDEALCCNKKIEKFNTLAAQAECRAKKLEEEARQAWCEYNEFVKEANEAAKKGERLMKASCKLLQESQECYSNINASNGNEINDDVFCEDDFDCGCNKQYDCNCGCNCGCFR